MSTEKLNAEKTKALEMQCAKSKKISVKVRS